MGILSFLFGGRAKEPAPSPLAGTKAPPPKPLSAPPEVTSEQEEGFKDLLFYVAEHKRLEDGLQSVRSAGVHGGRRLGFDVVLGAAWKEGSPGPGIPITTYQGFVTYRSTGADSDAFVQVLDELYGTSVAAKAMGQEVRFTAIALEGDPRDLSKGAVKIKLFSGAETEDRYAELFTNIDLPSRRLELREKDQEYRGPVVQALRAR